MGALHSKIILITAFVLSGLLGCQEKSQTSVTRSPAHIKHLKPGAAITLASDAILMIQPKEIVATDILLDVNHDLGELSLEFSASPGLSLVDTSTSIKLAIGQNPVRVPVKLLALTDGRFYLNIQARVTTTDSSSSRNLAVIVQAGATPEKPPQFNKPSGDQVISLPAQETISKP